ncbi:MAG: tetratricopeptide repeat protein [Anaerolineae bacterium]
MLTPRYYARKPMMRVQQIVLLLVALLLCACQNRPDIVAVTLTPTTPASIQSRGSATPSPQPVPVATIYHNVAVDTSQAYQALDEGDYQTVISITTGLLTQTSLPSREGLQLILAQAYLAEGQSQQVIDLLAPLADSGSQDDVTVKAVGLIARAYEHSKLWPQAIAAYTLFLGLRPDSAPDIHWRLAQLYTKAGDSAQAVQEYRQIDPEVFASSQRAELLEETAMALRNTGSFEDAMQVYDRILVFAQYASYRALVLAWQGDTLMQAGRSDEAIARWQQVYQEAPSSIAAYLALQSLDKAGEHPFTPLQEAWILYNVGQYEACLQAISRIIPVSGAETAGMNYLRGLVAEKQKQYTTAILAYDEVIDGEVNSSLTAEAWLARARAIEFAGENPVASYRTLYERYPGPYAATALWRSALYSQEHGDWSEAELDYSRLQVAYPTHELAQEASFRVGLMAYASTDVSRAQQTWLELKTRPGLDASMQTRLLFWLGVAGWRLDGLEEARNYWAQAAAADPYGYYGLRAQDHIAGTELIAKAQTQIVLSSTSPSELDYLNLSEWITTWYSDTLPPLDLGQDPLYRRTLSLLDLGWSKQSLAAFTRLREKYAQQPSALLALARLGEQLKVNSVSIDCAVALMYLAWEAGETTLPPALWRLAYPVPYSRLFSSESQAQGIDASLLLALVRQESQFNPLAISPAGAMGMAQVMPSTGEYIASQLGINPFQTQMLLSPHTSLSFGAWYLAQALKTFNGDILAGLAAYNAGPGTVQRWLRLLNFADSDLFFELVPYAETRSYLRQVYRNYRAYERISQP